MIKVADTEIWRAALLMVKRYGDDAMLEAAVRADKLLDARGNLDGAQTSHQGVYSRDI